uniref:Uncharacterized protein n=1 Tax=Hordeum vulgare subsp. vulgare TaxID=112509 RepID=A0A8I6WUW7_HORVV
MTPCPNEISAFENVVRCFAEKPTQNVTTLVLSTTFDSLGEVYNLYILYSWEKGFGIWYEKRFGLVWCRLVLNSI